MHYSFLSYTWPHQLLMANVIKCQVPWQASGSALKLLISGLLVTKQWPDAYSEYTLAALALASVASTSYCNRAL